MDVKKLMAEGSLDNLSEDLFKSVSSYSEEVKAFQRQKAAEYADQVVAALKKIEQDIKDRYDRVGLNLEKRVLNIKDGKDGINGRDGRDGKDGKAGTAGLPGRDGKDGKNGRDGVDGKDGVSVVNAFLDFDNSLVIELSNGKQVNAGAVLGADFAEKVKIIANGGGTSQGVIDTLASLQAQITAISSLGAVSYQGTWNASTNTPTITASVGTKGYYYVVSVAGTTSINGESKWGVGDWIVFNGSTWQKVDGGSTGNLTTLDVSGAATIGTDLTLSGGTANGVAYLNGSKVVTTGSALTFDGSKLLVSSSGEQFKLLSSGDFTSTGTSYIRWYDSVGSKGYLGYVGTANTMQLSTGGSGFNLDLQATGSIIFEASAAEQMRLTSTGLGIGTSSPGYKLDVTGADLRVNTPSGTAALRLARAGTNKWAIYNDTSENLHFYSDAAGLDRAVLDSLGNLGLGTSSISGLGLGYTTMAIQGANGGAIRLYGGSTEYGTIYADSTAMFLQSKNSVPMSFYTGGSERMRLDSSGNLGIGTSSPGAKLDVSGTSRQLFYVSGADTEYRSINAAGSAFAKQTYNASSFDWGLSNAFGKMVLDSSGNLLVGTTDNTTAAGPGVKITYGGGSTLFLCTVFDSAASNNFYHLYNTNATNNGYRFYVNSNGGISNYQANDVNLSDRREKTNFAPAKSYLDTICAIPVQTFNYIDQNLEEDAGLTLGVVAQDVQAVAPELVMESNWGTEEEPKMRLSIYQTDLQYALMKCIQELKAEVDSLKAQLNK